jgi:uncharacterized membrane protein
MVDMVDIVCTAAANLLRIMVRPNSATNGQWRRLVLALLLPVFCAVGFGFTLLGAWPVLPCLLTVMLALGLALGHIERHAGDFECLTFREQTLTLHRHTPRRDEFVEFNCAWVQLVSHDIAPGETRYLALRSHGHEHPVGRHLSDWERATVGHALRLELNKLRH